MGRALRFRFGRALPASPRVKTPPEIRAMEVDWSAAAGKWDTAAEFLKAEFTAPLGCGDSRGHRRDSRGDGIITCRYNLASRLILDARTRSGR